MHRLVLAFAITLPLSSVGLAAPRGTETLCFGMPATVADHSGEIVGTPGDDVIIGDDRPNVIYGEGGIDRICSLGGNDTIETPCCADGQELYAEAGTGNDEVEMGYERRSVVRGGDGDDYLGGSFNDEGADEIDGGAGDDRIWAFEGDDVLRGGAGNDQLEAHEGDDLLDGGDGADELYGEEGFDTLDGGTSTHAEKERVRKGKKKNGKPKFVTKIVQVEDSDLCQVGPGGGTATNCEREV